MSSTVCRRRMQRGCCHEHAVRYADHRGVPGSPGRTATIVPEEGVATWGIAFKLPEDTEERRAALIDLEWREKQYGPYNPGVQVPLQRRPAS